MESGDPTLGWAQEIPWGSYLVTPTSRERFSQRLPVEKGTGELGQASGSQTTPSCHQQVLGTPESWNPWSPGHLLPVSQMLKNTAFTGRETETQPGKPGRSKAHQFCLAERDSQPSWAVCSLRRVQVAQRLSQALTPVSQGQLLLEGQSGEAWSQSCQDQYISEAPDFRPVSKLQEGHVHHGMKREVRWGTLPAHVAEYVPGGSLENLEVGDPGQAGGLGA